jgi:hypothetical protein
MYLTIAIFALGILYLAAWRGVLKKLLGRWVGRTDCHGAARSLSVP